MDEPDPESTPLVSSDEAELQSLLGMFDAPAFARRGADLEYALGSLRRRLSRERDGMLDMVRVRLKQWAGAATGPDDYQDAFLRPVVLLWPLAGAGPGPTAWAVAAARSKRRRAIARDLLASVERFDTRWSGFLARLRLDTVNRQIEQYNRFYVLEKECVLGSARLAARNFVPMGRLSRESLLVEFPLLPLPDLAP